MAQSVVGVVLRKFSPEEIIEIEEIGALLEGLLPYTERHFRRLSKLQEVDRFFYKSTYTVTHQGVDRNPRRRVPPPLVIVTMPLFALFVVLEGRGEGGGGYIFNGLHLGDT